MKKGNFYDDYYYENGSTNRKLISGFVSDDGLFGLCKYPNRNPQTSGAYWGVYYIPLRVAVENLFRKKKEAVEFLNILRELVAEKSSIELKEIRHIRTDAYIALRERERQMDFG
jgi:hypothetical protein